ncbi:MAG: SixA phosphatase family protein [Pyrinomonadaceae bacterium]
MKRLFLLRHAKSSWAQAEIADIDRPLDELGRQAAPFMGRMMLKGELRPDVILSSTARRARETIELLKDAAAWTAEVRFDEGLYEAGPHSIIRVLCGLPDQFESAMVVGHNPGLEELIQMLTGELVPMSTSSLAMLDLRIERWAEVGPATGKLVEVVRPKSVAVE